MASIAGVTPGIRALCPVSRYVDRAYLWTLALKATLGNVLTPSDYGVDRILAHRVVNGTTEYLVQWEGCSYLQSTYEPECNLTYAQTKLSAYQNKRRKIVTDVASVMCDDPWRNGTVVTLSLQTCESSMESSCGDDSRL